MQENKVIQPSEVKWEPHSRLTNIKVAYLLSNRVDKTDLTCFLVHSPVGTMVEKHIHENPADVVYVVKGKAADTTP